MSVVKPTARRFYQAKRLLNHNTDQKKYELKSVDEWPFAKAESVKSSWIKAIDRWALLTGDTELVDQELWPKLAQTFPSEEQREHIATHMERLVYTFYERGLQGAALWIIYKHMCNGDPLLFVQSIDSTAKQQRCRKWLESLRLNHKSNK